MDVKKVVELQGNRIQFEGTLTTEETELVIESGLCFLLLSGALPLIFKKQAEEQIKQQQNEALINNLNTPETLQ